MTFDWHAYQDLSSLLENLRAYKESCLENNICPKCGNDVGIGIGTGRLADGIFCSLKCYASFREVESRFINPPSRN